jgi:protein-tyrosine phosphatase
MSAPESGPYRILFVCLGNICRSPLAEGVFRHLARERGLDEAFEVDSAGTGGWHVGEPPDARAAEVAERHGIVLEGRGRQVARDDFGRFHLVLAMDEQNRADLESLRDADGWVQARGASAELRLLREFDPEREGDLDVPDPYYGGRRGFDRVFEMVRRSCETLLDELEERVSSPER